MPLYASTPRLLTAINLLQALVSARGQQLQPALSRAVQTENFYAAEVRQRSGPSWDRLRVEVISRTDTYTETDARIKQYLASGVRVVWTVDSWMRTVTVYEPDGNIHTITEHGQLAGGTIIPGFAILVASLFA
jgi:hypothetical protein